MGFASLAQRFAVVRCPSAGGKIVTSINCLHRRYGIPRLVLIGALVACGESQVVAVDNDLQVATVDVDPGSAALTVGETVQLAATGVDANGVAVQGTGAPQWDQGDAAIVTVSSSGLVTAVGPGSTTVSATIDGISG